jgi:Glycosyltransferase family 87
VTVVPTRRASLAPPRFAIVAALAFCAALALLVAAGDRPEPSLSPDAAEAAALRDPVVRERLGGQRYDRVRTTALDRRLTRVSFFAGQTILLEAAVTRSGRVTNVIPYDDGYVRAGSEIGQRPLVLGGLVALFLLATLRLPLRRLANLDALALAGFTVPVVLLNERLLAASLVTGAALVAYLGARCAQVALGREPAKVEGPWLADRMPARVLVSCAVGAAAALALLSIPGGAVSDVAYASMAGATEVLHGALPYGNLLQGELVHGDTYPLLTYVAYIPAALVMPVQDGFDNLDGALWVATGFALIAAAALAAAARGGGSRGARPALAFLVFPPVMVATSSGSNDLVAAALVALALAVAARPGRSSAALAVAGFVKLAPFAVLPFWIARWRSWRAGGAVLLTVALVAASILALGGPDGFSRMIEAISFQADRGSLLSVWTLFDLRGLQLVFQAAVLAGIGLACVHVWRDRVLAKDPRRLAALAATVLLAIQLAANYWTYAYLAWVFPLVALALLCGPTPARSRAAAPAPADFR